MKNASKISKLAITIILAILITIIILLNVSISTILKEEYILKKMEESNYYEMLYQELQITFDKYITQFGLRNINSQGIFTKEQVKEDMQKAVQNIYQGTENKLSTESIKDKLNERIQNQLEEETITDHSEQAINKLIDTVGKDYEKNIYQNYSSNSLKQIKLSIKITYIIIVILIIVLVFISIKLQKKRTILLVGIAMLVAGVILEFANIFINSKIVIENVNSLAKSIYTTVQLITNDILSKMLSQSIVMMIIGVVAIVLGNVFYKKKIK